MKHLLLTIALILCSWPVAAQVANREIRNVTSNPTSCASTIIYKNTVNATLWGRSSVTGLCVQLGSSATGDVTSGAVIADNAIVRGDGGAKGVQSSGIVISDSNGLNCSTDGGCDIGNGLADFRDLSLKRNLILRGSTSGTTTVSASAIAGTTTFTLPAVTGTAVVGSTGATDNAILRADGTGGATAQSSNLTVSDDGAILTVAAFGAASNIGVDIQSKGSGEIRFLTPSDATSFVRVRQFGVLGVVTSGGTTVQLTAAGGANTAFVQIASNGQFGFNNGDNLNSGAIDAGLARSSAGVIKPTNGSTGYGKFEMAASVTWSSGSGSPEGVVTAAVGSLYTRTDGGANTTLYVKESGSGNTGWVAK